MNAFPLPATISLEEYLELENASELRHEFVGGAMRAMAGGTNDHAAICFNLNGDSQPAKGEGMPW